MAPELTEELRAGRRALEWVQGYTLLQDWTWYESPGRWALRCRLSFAQEEDLREGVPAASEWYGVVEPDYPNGEVSFHPAKDSGLTSTFPHQRYNGPGAEGLPWRAGKLCLDTGVRALGRFGFDDEPIDADERLAWHCRRALEWLTVASRGELALSGEAFELPDLPASPGSVATIAFAEGPESLAVWQALAANSGLVDLVRLRSQPALWLARALCSRGGKVVHQPAWGECANAAGSPERGLWVRLRQPPVLPPWQAPATWGELRAACAHQGVDWDGLFAEVAGLIRDRKPHFLLVGFPAPAVVGGEARQMHWLGLELPVLSYGKHTAAGFRPMEPGYLRRDRTQVLTDATPLRWATTENWHPDELATRGRLPLSVREPAYLLLGAGVVGAAVVELLVRGGVTRIVVCDGDILEGGNLARHTLGVDAVGIAKAAALARRLNWLSPIVTAKYVADHFPPANEEGKALVAGCEVVLDCTGSDKALRRLSVFDWEGDKVFLSISLGFGAQRLYCFVARGSRFPLEEFHGQIEPWLRLENQETGAEQLPRAGVGCWHPVFPARADDTWLMSAAAVKWLEAAVTATPAAPQLTVLGQNPASNQSAMLGFARLPAADV
ncbi:MAG: ThiF family adenylyltransferase [Chloroflexota bacterium]